MARFHWLRAFFGGTAATRAEAAKDLDDEIAFHLASEKRRRMEQGVSAHEAELNTAHEFGNVPLIAQITRETWRWSWRERLGQDLSFALRTFRRDLVFSTAALSTLAVGIAATVSIFTVVNALLLKPLPFPEPDDLVMVWERTPQGQPQNVVSTMNFVDWRARNQAFEHLGAISWIPMNITGLGEAEQVDGMRVTAEFFQALAVAPAIGRTVRSGEDVAGGLRSVVLSHAFWQRRFGGTPEVLGRMLAVNGLTHEIVGVMPQGFSFPGLRAEVFIPLPLDFAALGRGRNLMTVGRLKRGITIQQAESEMVRVAGQLATERPELNAGYSASVMPLMEWAVGETRQIVWVLFGAVSCLLILTCANVANLFLIRAATRAQEMSVRLAIGAGRWRLAHQLLVESVLLTTSAAGLGLLIASWIVPAVPALFPDSFRLPRESEVAIDRAVVSLTFITATAIGALLAVVTWRNALRTDVAQAIRRSGRSIRGSDTRLRRVLVVVEVALAAVLVVGAGLMGRSLIQLQAVNPGFVAERVLSMRMLLLPSKYTEAQSRIRVVGDVLNAVRATPGVISASSVHFLPLTTMSSATRYFRSDRPEPTPDALEGNGGSVWVVMNGYYRSMGIALLQGRDFDGRERRDGPRQVIVNETLASQWFPDASPVGRHLSVSWSTAQPVPYEIIGVVGDVRSTAIDAPAGPGIYISHLQEPSPFATLVVRARENPGALATAVKAAIASVDPEQGVSQVQSLDVLIANTTARSRVQTIVLSAFGALALLIASIGIYGVMSYTVEQRRSEIGVRMALGASPRVVLRSVMTEGGFLALIGIALSMVFIFVIEPYVASLLYETAATDLQVLTAVGVTLLVVSTFATLVPARRATRIDPIVALRSS